MSRSVGIWIHVSCGCWSAKPCAAYYPFGRHPSNQPHRWDNLDLGGVLLAFSSLAIFLVARTTTVPFQTASKLITWGPYRFTRNPMYVGLILIYVGVAAIQVQIWPILLLPLVVIYIHRLVVPVEEARLRQVFGDTYEQFCARVRRWL
jgi:protein-S-isoprenylcysteine O-methyltransferase Ste14